MDHLRINSVRFRLIASESDNREFRLHLARVHFHHPDFSVDKLSTERVSKRPHRRLGSAVNCSARIRLSSGNRANVDDIATATTGIVDTDNLLGELVVVSNGPDSLNPGGDPH